MNFATRAEKATKDVLDAIQFRGSEVQAKRVAKIIENAMIDSYRDCTELCVDAAVECCEPDKDMAHKIADEIRRANTALIANLSSLR